MKKWLSIGVLAGTLLVSSQHTSQAEPLDLDGFVCNVGYFSPEINPAGGRFGSVGGSLRTEPSCQGSFIDTFSLYSTGQTLNQQNNAFTQPQLMQMFQALQSQGMAGHRVHMFSKDTAAGIFRGVSSISLTSASGLREPRN
jgi:hypothetical protein